jgi:ComF family protein
MLDIFTHIYDTIFPPHESLLKLRSESTGNFSRHLRPLVQPNWTALAEYHNPYIKAAVTANKFHNSEWAATLLTTLLDTWLTTEKVSNAALVPIPLSAARQKSRGFNQVARILKHSRSDLPVIPLLTRTRDTTPQTSLERADRLKNITGAFELNHTYLPLPVAKIILVDDVTTTGATLNEAKATLVSKLPEEYEIMCIALAH